MVLKLDVQAGQLWWVHWPTSKQTCHLPCLMDDSGETPAIGVMVAPRIGELLPLLAPCLGQARYQMMSVGLVFEVEQRHEVEVLLMLIRPEGCQDRPAGPPRLDAWLFELDVLMRS